MGLRDEKKAEQRRAILEAATALFRKRGYENTRVQDLIERLRISEATFFNYFPTKEALLFEFALEDLDRAAVALRTELERSDQGAPDRIRGVMKAWMRGWAKDRRFSALVVRRSRMMSGPEGELREKSLRNYDLFAQLFREGQQRGEIRDDVNPMQLAEMLEGIFVLTAGNWLFQWWKDNHEPIEKRLMTAVNIFLDGCDPSIHRSAQSVGAGAVSRPRLIARANRGLKGRPSAR